MKFFGKKQNSISITNDTIVRAIVITILAILFWRMLGKLTGVLTLLGLSAFLALALNPAVSWIGRHLRTKNRALSTGIAYISVLVILIAFMIIVVPPLVRQSTDFARNIPSSISNFQNQDTSLARTIRRYKLDSKIDDVRHDISNRVDNISGPVLSTAGRLGTGLAKTITVIVLTFMLLVEGPLWINRIIGMMPADSRDKRKRVAHKMYRVVTGYVNGQLLVALLAAGFASIALLIGSTLADVSVNVAALAGIVFIFGLIPLIGNTIAAILVCIFCLFSSTGLAIGMLAYFIVYQQIENATLQPFIQSRNNQLTPLLVFVSALIGANLYGLLGALAAIPVAGCIRVIFDEYVADKLPDEDDVVTDITKTVKGKV
ncbi:MAG TPA: AI-2E family transporter [Candidatus Saccharimonadales bacterium]|nr:AI-2E family transporter [Candidatus Saccharimonadales bacterium]